MDIKIKLALLVFVENYGYDYVVLSLLKILSCGRSPITICLCIWGVRANHNFVYFVSFLPLEEIICQKFFHPLCVTSKKDNVIFREPVEGPWLHGAVIHLLDNGEAEVNME